MCIEKNWSSSFVEKQKKFSEWVPTRSQIVWKFVESMCGRRRKKKSKFQCCFDSSGTFFFRVLHGRSGRNFYWSFIRGQCDNSKHSSIFFICQFALCHQFGITTWRPKIEQQTDCFFFFFIFGQSHTDLLAQWLHEAFMKHQNTVCWVDITLVLKKVKFYQIRSNAIILQETLPAHCIPKVVRMKNWRSLKRKSIHVISASAKDLLETRMEKRIRFRTRSTIRSWAAICKFPIEPTNF